MAYNITLTNGSLFATVPDGTVNNASSMTLIGQNYVGQYGEFQNDNFIRLLESNANNSAPTAPLVGQLWYNTQTRVLEVYNGTAFKPLGGANATATAPTNNTVGDLWYDTLHNQLFAWSGTGWILIGPVSTTGTGAVAVSIIDNTLTPRDVIELVVNGNIVAMISQSATFTPNSAISGFGNISPGVTLSTQVNSQTPLFTGTATNSEKLGGQLPAAYMSAITNTATTGTLDVLNNGGIGVGLNRDFTASVANSLVSLKNTALNGNIDISTNKGGTQTSAIFINGNTSAVTIAGNLFVNGSTVTVNQEIINTSEIIAGNLTAANITSNAFLTAQSTTTQTLSVTGSLIGNTANVTTVTATVGNLTTVNSTTVNTTTVNSTTVNGNLISTTANAVRVNLPTWTIQEFGGKLYFQSGGVNVASLSSSGDFVTIGDVTAFGTP